VVKKTFTLDATNPYAYRCATDQNGLNYLGRKKYTENENETHIKKFFLVFCLLLWLTLAQSQKTTTTKSTQKSVNNERIEAHHSMKISPDIKKNDSFRKTNPTAYV
jgi:hypothetical protein